MVASDARNERHYVITTYFFISILNYEVMGGNGPIKRSETGRRGYFDCLPGGGAPSDL